MVDDSTLASQYFFGWPPLACGSQVGKKMKQFLLVSGAKHSWIYKIPTRKILGRLIHIFF
jgi:hypothetical protein